MSNPFEEIFQKLESIDKRLTAFESKSSVEPSHIPFPQFCQDEDITRPTGKAWAQKGLITLEKKGGRLYVLRDSIRVQKKYQRAPIAA